LEILAALQILKISLGKGARPKVTVTREIRQGAALKHLPQFTVAIFASLLVFNSRAQEQLQFSAGQFATNGDFSVRVVKPSSPYLNVERSGDLLEWQALVTVKSAGTNDYADSGAVYRGTSFYRAVQLDGTNILTGDHLSTTNGDLVFHPINHASLVMSWNGLTIYNDPVGATTLYAGIPRADVVLVSHDHSDHFSASTLSAIRRTNDPATIILASAAVYSQLSSTLKAITTVLANGVSTNVYGIQVDAIPAYNSNHPKGTGNGYVLTLGGKRVYFSGDTGDITEMKALRDIDVAFVCMNVPFTMTVGQASGAVRAFAPRAVYPYHFRNQDGTYTDLNAFRRQVGTDLGVEVRARKWY